MPWPRALIAAALQWGRDRLIAETMVEAGDITDTQALQWGRDRLIAETVISLAAERGVSRASMGPRSFDRGNAYREIAEYHGWELQWGRDRLIAETA